MEYLKNLAKLILKDEIKQYQKTIEHQSKQNKEIIALSNTDHSELQKLKKKIKRLEDPENILISYYRIDNITPEGTPPPYLNPANKTEYTQRIAELESVYRNTAFREMMAWALNFHANLAAGGKIINKMGDQVDIDKDAAEHMINGIKSIWELIVAAHNKDREFSLAKHSDAYDILDSALEEGDY